MEIKFSKIELEYVLGLVENDLQLSLYNTKRLLALNDLYNKLIILNK